MNYLQDIIAAALFTHSLTYSHTHILAAAVTYIKNKRF
jgi:hypothetical protein